MFFFGKGLEVGGVRFFSDFCPGFFQATWMIFPGQFVCL